MITLARGLLGEMLRHLENGYPREACGVILGRQAGWQGGEAHRVTEVRPISSTEGEFPRKRYSMDSRELLEADEAARRRGDSLIGVYHSHPDGPARPSAVDLGQAWPAYTYLVASVRRGAAAEWACWVLDGAREAFRPRVVRLTGER